MSGSILETDRLIIRDFSPDDFERVHSYSSVPDFSQFEMWGPNTKEDTEAFLHLTEVESLKSPRYQFTLAICLKESKLLIGGGGIRRDSPNSRIANLGWAIHPEFQNLGFATEAAKAFVDFGFSDLNAVLIYARCDTRNTASWRVMEKIGMKNVGVTEKDRIISGKTYDSYRYEILRP